VQGLRPRVFDYYSASNLKEALSLLRTKEDSRILAGGQSLVPMMKLRLASPNALIDINRIKDLNYIKEDDRAVKIGALTRHDQIEQNPIMTTKVPILSQAASLIGDQQIRNRGTIGGTVAHADPAADLPTALMASDASIVATSADEDRVIGCNEFFKEAYTTDLRPNEMVREVRIPVPQMRAGSSYSKLSGKSGVWSVVNVAVSIRLKGEVCSAASIVLGSLLPAPYHAIESERMLVGERLSEPLITAASGKCLARHQDQLENASVSAYRKHVAKEIVKRTINLAWENSRGDEHGH
jgi:CO/xanthine dehydrogenase FAD-binding subunit